MYSFTQFVSRVIKCWCVCVCSGVAVYNKMKLKAIKVKVEQKGFHSEGAQLSPATDLEQPLLQGHKRSLVSCKEVGVADAEMSGGVGVQGLDSIRAVRVWNGMVVEHRNVPASAPS